MKNTTPSPASFGREIPTPDWPKPQFTAPVFTPVNYLQAEIKVSNLSQELADCADEIRGCRQAGIRILRNFRSLHNRLSDNTARLDKLNRRETELFEQLAKAELELAELAQDKALPEVA